MTFLKKFWLPLVFLLTILYFVNSMYQSNIESKRKEAARVQQQLAIENSELDAIRRANANYKWIGKYISDIPGQIFTADLEKDWLNGQPIFFPGYIADISSLDNNQYLLTIKYLKPFYLIPGTTLKLECEKPMVDEFLRANPSVRSKDAGEQGMAVIASIAKVGIDESKHLVGSGKCVELLRDAGPFEQYSLIKFN